MSWGRLAVASYFEEMGILVKAQGIDEKTVWHLYCYAMEGYFEMILPAIDRVKKESGDNTAFSEFCSLVSRMREINKNEGSKDFGRTDTEKSIFADTEVQFCTRLLGKGESS